MSGSGRTPAGLVGNFPIRFPTILPDPQSAQSDKRPISGENDPHYSPVAIQTLVPSSPFDDHGLSNFITSMDSYIEGSSGKSPSISDKLISGFGGLDSIRDALEKEGLSQEACELIVDEPKRRRDEETKGS